ncbi:MAG: hypothetical protein V2I63_01270 [Pseudomonadales bacterium]|jgi:hypothetical protein|nr:hypothetical protein [Pseudomonadales bacterium]
MGLIARLRSSPTTESATTLPASAVRGRRLLCALMLGCLGTLGASASAAEAANTPAIPEVRDLHYGEVLFHYFAGDRFSAIVLLEVARQQALLRHHGEEALLLQGGLSLDYGLRRRAREILFGLLEGEHTAEIRQQARIALARDAWRTGDPQDALDVLAPVDLEARGTLRDEVQLLRALALLALDQPDAAAESLAGWETEGPLSTFASFNRAVALLRTGQAENALRLLDAVGRDPDSSPALRDRANLAAGYSLLESDAPDLAAERFMRIRLEGPYARQGLLGAGWAAADAGRLEAAVQPWTRLTRMPAVDPAVQEALIALPYIYAQTLDPMQAAAGFERSIALLDEERGRIGEASAELDAGALLGGIHALLGDPGASAEALLDELPTTLSLFVGEMIAGHRFRSHVTRLRELEAIEMSLLEWQDKVASFDIMLATREARYAERLPTVLDPRIAEAAADFASRRDRARADFEARVDRDDPMALLTPAETAAWTRLEDVRARLERLPAAPVLDELRDKQRVLAGLVRWNATREQAERTWAIRKALDGVDQELGVLDDRRASLEGALVSARAGFEGFAGRIENVRQRIAATLPRVREAREQETRAIEALARAFLDERNTRLQAQIGEARFELARLYERAALAGVTSR